MKTLLMVILFFVRPFLLGLSNRYRLSRGVHVRGSTVAFAHRGKRAET